MGEMTNKHYHEIDGELLARVSSISGQLEKFGLVPWAANCAVDYIGKELATPDKDYAEEIDQILDYARTEHKRQSDEAKEVGEIVHTIIHDVIGGKELMGKSPSDDINSSMIAFATWCNRFHPKPLALEQLVHNKRRKRAGRFDFLGHIKAPEWRKHRLYLIDWKTSKSLYFEDLIQISLYFYDYQLLTGTKIAGAANLRLDKNTGKYQWKPYPRYKLRNAYRIGNHLTAIWHLRHGK